MVPLGPWSAPSECILGAPRPSGRGFTQPEASEQGRQKSGNRFFQEKADIYVGYPGQKNGDMMVVFLDLPCARETSHSVLPQGAEWGAEWLQA